MSTKIKPILQRFIGHIPFTSVVSDNGHGKYLAAVKFNGKEYVGSGDSERKATIELRKIMDDLETIKSISPTR